MHFELSPLIVWIALWIVNTYSKFEVIIFSNNRDITKRRSFCTTTIAQENYDAKAIAIPRVFSENSRAKKDTTDRQTNDGRPDDRFINSYKLQTIFFFCVCVGGGGKVGRWVGGWGWGESITSKASSVDYFKRLLCLQRSRKR